MVPAGQGPHLSETTLFQPRMICPAGQGPHLLIVSLLSCMIRPVRRGQGSRTNGSFPKGTGRLSENLPTGYPLLHHRDDTTRERGRPARILSLGLSLSFPAMRHPATLPAGIAWARPKQSHGVVAVRSGSRRWVRLYQDLYGRDARAPGGAFSHDVVTPTSQYCRSIRAPLVIEGAPSLFVPIRVHSWFVFISKTKTAGCFSSV